MASPPVPPINAPPDGADQADALAFQAESQLIGSRMVHFRTRQVQPPAALYVTADDGLYCLVSNIQPGLVLNLTATVLLPDGRVQPNSWSMAAPSTGAQTPYLFPLAESFLLNVSVQPASGVRYGQTWIFVAIRRGGLSSGINLQTLISDSLSSFGGPTWPGSQLRHSVSDPGLILTQYTASNPAGQQFAFVVPNYARVKMRSVLFHYTAGAGVGNRNPTLAMYDASANAIYFEELETAVTASQTVILSWGLILGYAQTLTATLNAVRSLPDIVMMPGFTMILNAVNIFPADAFSGINLSWEQWFSF